MPNGWFTILPNQKTNFDSEVNGYELLDFVCPDDAQEEDYQNLFDNLFRSQINFEESDGESSDSDDSFNEVLQDEGTATELIWDCGL